MGHLFIKAEYRADRGGRFVEGKALIGSTLLEVLQEAESLARRLECGVGFDFNGNWAWIRPYDDPRAQMEWLRRIWSASRKG